MAWAIQRADERWLASDYGWTCREDDVLCFSSQAEAQAQVDRLVTGRIACRAIAVSEASGSSRKRHPVSPDVG